MAAAAEKPLSTTSTIAFFWKGDIAAEKKELCELELNFGAKTSRVFVLTPRHNTNAFTQVTVQIERTWRPLVYKVIPDQEELTTLSLKIDQIAALRIGVNVLKECEKRYNPILANDGIFYYEIGYKREECEVIIRKPALDVGVNYELFITSTQLFIEAELKIKEPPRLATPINVQSNLSSSVPTNTQAQKEGSCTIT